MTEVDKRKLPFPAKEDLLLQKFELRDEVEDWVRWMIVSMLLYWFFGRKQREAKKALASLEAFASYAKLPPLPGP
jgi:hypothetical protein